MIALRSRSAQAVSVQQAHALGMLVVFYGFCLLCVYVSAAAGRSVAGEAMDGTVLLVTSTQTHLPHNSLHRTC